MRHYYQWTPAQRLDGDRLVKDAISKGLLPDPNTQACVICGKREGVRHYHQEDYTPEHIVENSMCVCAACHKMIHMRWWWGDAYRRYMLSKVNGRKYMDIFQANYESFKAAGGGDPAAK